MSRAIENHLSDHAEKGTNPKEVKKMQQALIKQILTKAKKNEPLPSI